MLMKQLLIFLTDLIRGYTSPSNFSINF
ncbi:hypothetical protein Gotur_028085 [Gossypium turneri]